MDNMPKIWTPGEIAEYLKIAEVTIVSEIVSGKLNGFQVGCEWRVSSPSLINFIEAKTIQNIDVSQSKISFSDSEFVSIEPFDYQWPHSIEHYDKGFTTSKTINGQQISFRIGFTEREAAGMKRKRVVVWIADRPLVEFAGGNDFDKDGLLASIIKLSDNKQLTPYQKIPSEYKDFKIAKYNSLVKGPRASTNMAIIVHQNDFDKMISHAIFRAKSKHLI